MLGHRAGTCRAGAGGDHRHGRHNSPLAPRADGTQMCAATAAKRPSSCRGSGSVIDQAYGHRERNVGLYPNPGRLKEPRPLCGPVDDCSDPQGTGRPSERPTPYGVANVYRGPLACAARLRSLHELGGDIPRISHPLHGFAPRAANTAYGCTPRLSFRTTAFCIRRCVRGPRRTYGHAAGFALGGRRGAMG